MGVGRHAAWLGLAVFVAACGGRDQPRLYSVVAPEGTPRDACLPLREPALTSLSPGVAAKLRPSSDEYVWLVGESMETATGLAGFLSSLSGRTALVSLSSSLGGASATRAIATLENGKVTHTYFGTPLTPPFPNDDGAQLSLSFEARVLDNSALTTAKTVLDAMPTGPQYGALVTALMTPAAKTQQKPEVLAQTYVLADPRTCASGACQAVIVDQRLVVISADPRRNAGDLGPSLCLKDGRLYERDGMDEYGGAYAVLRVAHARLPEEALGETLASKLAALSRCDKDFTPATAAQALDALGHTTLRANDREAMRALLEEVAAATKAQKPEDRLEVEWRVSEAAKRVCTQTPAEGIACARARGIQACAGAKLAAAAATRDAFRQARETLARLESATGCDARGSLLVALDRDVGALAVAAREAHLEGACSKAATGLVCDAFPDMSRRSRLAVADSQDAIYRECFCPALAKDSGMDAASRSVREALKCTSTPEEFALVHHAEQPIDEREAREWSSKKSTELTRWTPQQCPACHRLARRIDDELTRAVLTSRDQAALAVLLRDALAPVMELRDRAFLLMSGDVGVRCASRPDEWSVLVQAVGFAVEPRDLFREGARLDPSLLDAKLAKARLLRSSIDGLACVQAPPEPPQAPSAPPAPGEPVMEPPPALP